MHSILCSFSLSTSLLLLDRNGTVQRLLARAFPGQQPFVCRLEVLPTSRGVPPRAIFSVNGAAQMEWPCGAQALDRAEQRTLDLHIQARIA